MANNQSIRSNTWKITRWNIYAIEPLLIYLPKSFFHGPSLFCKQCIVHWIISIEVFDWLTRSVRESLTDLQPENLR